MSVALILRCRPKVKYDTFFVGKRCVHNEASKEREKQIRQYVLSRYMEYVQQYASVLEKKFPTAMRVYRVFTIGIKQKHEFTLIEHRKCLRHYKSVLRSLQWKVDSVKECDVYVHWEHVIRLLGSGLHPTPSQVLVCKPLFAEEQPYHLNSLYSSHVKELLKIHSMHTGWRRRKRLSEKAKLIQLMDNAICKEGGVCCLSQDEIRTACLFRGLNPSNMKREDMEQWLEGWMLISQSVTEDSRSLLLHSPVLLAYNHPSNWVLLH